MNTKLKFVTDFHGQTINVDKSDFEINQYIGGQYAIAIKNSYGGNTVFGGDPACEDHYDKEFVQSVFDNWDGVLYWNDTYGYLINP